MGFGMFTYIPLLTERDHSVGEGYKHRAPPEQEPEQQKQENIVLLRSKNPNNKKQDFFGQNQ